MQVKIEESWKKILQKEFNKPYFEQLANFVKDEYKNKTIYPPAKFIFEAFNKTPFDKVNIVILGQDPYHGENQAHGLSFSITPPTPPPPSLVNIYKEIETDLGKVTNKNGNLNHWADQGVMLLNATLTVRAHQAGSHQKKGWEEFTDAVIKNLSDKKENLIFILWGRYAQNKGKIINGNKHLIIESAHPSPLSAYNGFFGSKPFSKSNNYLKLHHKKPINW